eukprot:scaffold20711_cov124-Isochrysis_galbana.AAC.3
MFVWHLYVIPMSGPILGFNWPRKLLLLLEIHDIMRAIDYIIRESLELGGKDKALVVHYDPKGCKGYNMKVASTLISRGFNVRMCSCAFDKQEYDRRKIRRTETQNINIRAALGAPPPKPCQRFVDGICLLNKKGKKCSSSHDLPDMWDTSTVHRRKGAPSAKSNANSSPTRPSRAILGWATDCRVHRVRAPCTCAAPCADPVQTRGEFSFRVLIIARQALTETDRLLPHQAMGQHAHARRSRKTSSR